MNLGVRKDGGGPVQTSLTDLKPPAVPNHSKRITDLHGNTIFYVMEFLSYNSVKLAQ